MVIENRDLAVGTKLIAKYKGEQWKLEVLPGEPKTYGFVGKRPKDSAQVFKSPSSAGSAVMGGMSCNGWRFWSIEGEASAPTASRATASRTKAPVKASTKARTTKAKKGVKVFYRIPNQRGTPEGFTRFYCNGCAASFESDSEAPDACPQGHRNDDPELSLTSTADEAE